MRIAVTSQNFKTITRHAGRARRFLVFQSDAVGRSPVQLDLEARFAMHGFDDAMPHPLDGVDVLITGSAGDGLTRRLARRHIRVVCTAEIDPKEAVEHFIEGRLAPGAPHDHSECECHHHAS
jgi:predicted Fe-Mo cluster-binding NifX family protein